jgi:AbrB family looped-hinge helix DNA binding protein
MATTITIDKAGRLVLPKQVRDALQIRPGDSLELESSEDRVTLRPARGTARVYKQQGMWVLHGDALLPPNAVEDTIRRVRREREVAILGKHR